MKSALIVTMIAVAILGFGIKFSNDHYTKEFQIKNLQINSLIDEVGILQEQTKKLENTLEAIRKINIQKPKTIAQNFEGKVGSPSREILFIPPPNREKQEAFLLMGTHGYLTDTIILAISNSETKKIHFISIPRDLSVKGRKINEFYKLFGIKILAERIREVTGILPDKYMVIEMEGFEKMIDAIGGIDITVEKDIHDYQYPNKYGGYEGYSIKKGDYHMDGKEALKYARSRKSTSDFNRARRQQQIMLAIKEQMQKEDFLQNFGTLAQAYQSLAKYLDSNIGFLEMIELYRLYKEYEIETGYVLTPENHLYSTYNERGQYILLPKKGNFAEIQNFIEEITQKNEMIQ